MSDSDKQVGRIIGLVGKFAIDLGGEMGGASGLALAGAGALARKVAKLLDSGATVTSILKGMETFPDLVNPFKKTE